MYYIQRTDEFDEWLARLKDLRARAKIVVRIKPAELGNLVTSSQKSQKRDIEHAKELARKYEDILNERS